MEQKKKLYQNNTIQTQKELKSAIQKRQYSWDGLATSIQPTVNETNYMLKSVAFDCITNMDYTLGTLWL